MWTSGLIKKRFFCWSTVQSKSVYVWVCVGGKCVCVLACLNNLCVGISILCVTNVHCLSQKPPQHHKDCGQNDSIPQRAG